MEEIVKSKHENKSFQLRKLNAITYKCTESRKNMYATLSLKIALGTRLNMYVDRWFQYKSLKYRNKHQYFRVLWQYVIPSLWSLHPSSNKTDKNSKSLIYNILLNYIEFETFSRNWTSLMSDHLAHLLILKDFHRKPTLTNNIVYKRNYRFFNDNDFKNDLKSIPWENILSQANVQRLICFSDKLIPC